MNEPDEVRGTSPIASRCESTVEVASGRLGHDQDHDLDLERQAQDKYTMHAGRRECRICLQDDADSDLTRPCQCSGSLQYVHVDCLRRWVKESGRRNCEICKSAFVPELIEGVEPEGETAVWQRRPSRSDEPSPTSSRSKWMPIIAAVCILSGLVLVIVLIGLNVDQTWAAVMLRVLAFGIPALLIIRVVWVYYKAKLRLDGR